MKIIFEYVEIEAHILKFQQLNKLMYEIKMAQWFGRVNKRKVIIAYYKVLAEIVQTEINQWPAKDTLEVMSFKNIN